MKRPQPPKLSQTTLALIFLGLTALLNTGLIAFYMTRPPQADRHFIITDLVLQAARNNHTPLVISPDDGRQYVPEARLVLPAPGQSLGHLSYALSGDLVSISSNTDMDTAAAKVVADSNDLNQLFDQVPRLQACGRGVTVAFTPNPALHQVTKHLSDGRTAYLDMDSGCSNQALYEFVQKVDSY